MQSQQLPFTSLSNHLAIQLEGDIKEYEELNDSETLLQLPDHYTEYHVISGTTVHVSLNRDTEYHRFWRKIEPEALVSTLIVNRQQYLLIYAVNTKRLLIIQREQ